MADKDYISREAILKDYQTICNGVECVRCPIRDKGHCKFEAYIRSIPAADVRPVVMCRDCKWYQIDELKKDGTADRRYKPSVCVLAEQRRDPNHFCADGKKREETE